MELDRVGADVGGQVSEPSTETEPSAHAGRTQTNLIVAAVAGASAIMIGAFGAHGLQTYLPETGIDAETVQRRLGQFDTGARYHLAHAIVLLVLAVAPLERTRPIRVAFALFFCGIFFFSGSLYLLVLTNTPALGAITPLGGLSWIIGWVLIGFGRVRR